MPLSPSGQRISSTASSLRPAVPIASDGSVVDHELETRWESVRIRLTSILDQMNASGKPLRTMPQEWVHMYSDVARLYDQNDTLRKRRMYVYVRNFIRQLVLKQKDHLLPLSGPHLLSEYVRCWQSTLTYVKFMKRVLHHLQRFWIPENANTLKHDPVRPLDKLLMFYWREDLLSSLHSVVEVALSLIDDDRNSIPIDHDAVRGVVDNFVQLGTADSASPMDNQPLNSRIDHFARYNRQAASSTRSSTNTCGSQSPSDSENDPTPDSLPSLQLYHQVFEEDCLVRTRAFYKKEGARIVEGADVGTFMLDIKARMADEETRVRRLLHPDSAPRVLRAVEDELIGNHKEYLQEQACRMIEHGPENNLKLVYGLLDRIENGLAPIRVFFVNHVRTEGIKLVRAHVDKLTGKEDMKHNLELIEQLIHLHRKHSNLVKRCFDGCQFIMISIDDAFRGFLNRSMGTLSLPNILAHFIDYILRNSKNSQRTCEEIAKNFVEVAPEKDALQSSSADEASSSLGSSSKFVVVRPREEDPRSQCLTEVVRLFMYLEEKDLFFEAHRRLFAERLLSTHDQEAEHEFVSKLKVQMGSTFTQRLNGMLKDVISSNETRKEFEKYITAKRQELPLLEESGVVSLDAESSIAIRTDFNAHVLSALHWPALKTCDLRVPPILKACQDSFEQFYMKDKETRVLKWVPALSTLHLKATFGSTSYTFVVSTFQACVLLLFNDRDELTVGEASKLLNINIDELKRHIRPLLVGKRCKLLQLEKAKESVIDPPETSEKDGVSTGTRKESTNEGHTKPDGTAEMGGERASDVDGIERPQADQPEARDTSPGSDVGTIAKESTGVTVQAGEDAPTSILPSSNTVGTPANAESAGSQPTAVELSTAPVLMSDVASISQVAPNNATAANASSTRASIGNVASAFAPTPPVSLVLTVAEATSGMNERDGNESAVEINRGGAQANNTHSTEQGAVLKTRGAADSAPSNEASKDGAEEKSSSDAKEEKRSRDVLRLDVNFKSKLHRVVVPSTIAQAANNDTTATRKTVVVDRSTQIDATLVRIMKAKKQLSHSELFAEVIQELSCSFKPDPKLIKSRLERLIDQEYIQRDSDDARMYKYNA